MKRGKYEKVVPVTRKKRGLNTRIVTLMLALTLLVGVAVGGTIAWLTDKTEDVVNTFTVGNIDITLDETTGEDYKMVPGNIIDKDPIVTVEAGSEDCWVFIKVAESKNLPDYIAYQIDINNWTELENAGVGPGEKVYYTKYISRSDVDVAIKVLGEGTFVDPMGTENDTTDDVTVSWGVNQVGVKPSVTKQMMDAIDGENRSQPLLTFTAYAVQSANIATAADAWAKVNP